MCAAINLAVVNCRRMDLLKCVGKSRGIRPAARAVTVLSRLCTAHTYMPFLPPPQTPDNPHVCFLLLSVTTCSKADCHASCMFNNCRALRNSIYIYDAWHSAATIARVFGSPRQECLGQEALPTCNSAPSPFCWCCACSSHVHMETVRVRSEFFCQSLVCV